MRKEIGEDESRDSMTPKFPEGPDTTSVPSLDLGGGRVQQQKSQQVEEKAENRESLCPLPVSDSAPEGHVPTQEDRCQVKWWCGIFHEKWLPMVPLSDL